MLFSDSGILTLLVHVTAPCTTLPDASRLGATFFTSADAALPASVMRATAESDDFWSLNDAHVAWLRGDFLTLQAAADTLPPATAWMASLPAGSAATTAALHASAVDVWRLRTAGCSAIVLPLDELSAAAAASDWDAVAQELSRLRRPVSAVDYPPSIFMIGEDEARTEPEVT